MGKDLVKKLLCIVALMLTLTGCAAIEQEGSKLVASTVKLDRTVVLFSATGDTIATWTGKIYLDSTGGDGQSFMLNGKRIAISGTYVIEEN